MTKKLSKAKGSALSEAIREAHHGNTFKRTAAKHGKATAHEQAIAIGFSKRGMSRKKGKKSK